MSGNVATIDPWRKQAERRLAALERLQELRVKATEKRKAELDAILSARQLEIDNLRATLEVR